MAASMNPVCVETESFDPDRWLPLAQAGNSEAFGEICRGYESRLLQQSFRLCGNPTLAEDLAQDTLVEAWRCLGRFNGRCQFFTWLCAILLNRYRKAVRDRRSFPISTPASRDPESFRHRLDAVTDRDAWPDRAAELREQAVQVRACIQALPAKQREVIYLRFYVDDSLEGISEALGCPVGTVKSRLFHALENLRRMNILWQQAGMRKMEGEL
jgi:RNA polymerase sigma-70 factor (ECF subfamily)